MTYINITQGRGNNYMVLAPLVNQLYIVLVLDVFQIWNAMSNVIDSKVSLFAFKCKSKAFFLQNNELTVTM